MTRKQLNTCLSEAVNYSDVDAYVSEMALSSLWDDTEASDIPPERIEALRLIFEAAHRNIKDIASAAGTSVRSLAAMFNIPYRTVEDWAANKRTPPMYVLLMMQEILGLLPEIN